VNKPKELKLDMTNKEVAEILGKPENIKKDGYKAVACLYTAILDDEEINIKIRFVDNKAVHITRWSKVLNWDWEEL
jgi:hypothetical protein